MYQLALDAQKNPVAEVSILKLPEAAEAEAGVTVVTPLGTLLTNGLVLQIDGGEQPAVSVRLVQPGRLLRALRPCQDLDRRDEARQGRQDHAGLGRRAADAGGLDVSLTGFTDAFDALACRRTRRVPSPPPTPPPRRRTRAEGAAAGPAAAQLTRVRTREIEGRAATLGPSLLGPDFRR